jgi:hypothetical protein
MARDRYGDDDEGEGYAHGGPRPSTSPVVIVALVLGGVFVLGILVCAGIWFVGFSAPNAEERAIREGEERAKFATDTGGEIRGTPKVYTRQEFRDLVMGKTPDEVIAAVGAPDHTATDEFGTFWHYRARTTDAVTGKTDPNTRLEFKDGRVSEVNF